MRTASLMVAGFCLAVSLAELIMLLVIPETSISLTSSGAGGPSAASQSWATLILLALGLIASAAVLISLRRPGSPTNQLTVSIFTGLAVVVAVANYLLSRSMGWLGYRDVPWLNVTVAIVGIQYIATLFRAKRGT